MSDDVIHFGGKAFKATGKDASGRTIYSPAVFSVNPPTKVVNEKTGQITFKERRPTRIRQDNKPLMNKLEMEFFLRLQAIPGDIKFIRPQSIRFMLGNGIWYKPDFTGFLDGSYSAWEVKGPHAFRGGFENLKLAAHQYKEIHWHLVWKSGGEWKQQRVLP